MLTINRKQFLQGLAAGTAALSLDACGVRSGRRDGKAPACDYDVGFLLAGAALAGWRV